MAEDEKPKLVIEPLDPSKHDRAAFSCGVSQVDNFIKKTANKLTKADNLRVWVLTAEDEKSIIGFYAINAHSIYYDELPEKFARNRPGHGAIPAAYISMVGRDERFRGGGYGGILLADCLQRIVRIAEQIGTAVIVLDVIDCGDPGKTQQRKDLYIGYGFQPFPSMPMRMFLPIATIKDLVG